MRTLILPFVLLVGVAPAALADDTRASRPPPADPGPAPAPAAPATRETRPPPAPPADPGRAPRPPPPPGSADPGPVPPPGQIPPPPPGYYYPPYGYGWEAGWGAAWGYGYLPLYGEPVMVAPGAPPPWPPPPPPPSGSAVLRVSFGAGHMGGVYDGSSTGEIWGTSFVVDSRRLGFDMAFDAFTPTSVDGASISTWSSAGAYGLSSFHVTWSFLESRAYRVRMLVGGSWLSIPYSATSTGADSFGPDLGLSGQVGIVGPFGLEAHARWTPVPIMVFDGGAAAALRFGPFGLTMGYRWIEVASDARTGPAVGFQGPEMTLGVIF